MGHCEYCVELCQETKRPTNRSKFAVADVGGTITNSHDLAQHQESEM